MSNRQNRAAVDFTSVDTFARKYLPELVAQWLPDRQRTGNKYAHGRYVVDVKTGAWRCDKVSGKGAIALHRHINRSSSSEAASAIVGAAIALRELARRTAARVRRAPDKAAATTQDPTKGPLKGFAAGANVTLNAALDLVRERGWAVFPLRANKVPGKGSHGHLDAAADPDAIVKLWTQWSFPLIGVATGAVSGIDVLDVDFKHQPAHDWWHANCHRLPKTLTFRTRSGGLHLYFHHADGVGTSQNRVGTNIDVKGDGGYAVYWHAAGCDCLDASTVVAWPAWLLELAKKPPAPAAEPPTPREPTEFDHARIAGILNKVASAGEGERNGLLFWGACKLRGMVAEGAIDRDEACDELLLAARETGLAEREAIATIASGMRGR